MASNVVALIGSATPVSPASAPSTTAYMEVCQTARRDHGTRGHEQFHSE